MNIIENYFKPIGKKTTKSNQTKSKNESLKPGNFTIIFNGQLIVGTGGVKVSFQISDVWLVARERVVPVRQLLLHVNFRLFYWLPKGHRGLLLGGSQIKMFIFRLEKKHEPIFGRFIFVLHDCLSYSVVVFKL